MASAAGLLEKRGGDGENSYIIRPAARQKLPASAVKEMMKAIMQEKLGAPDQKYNSDLAKLVSDAIKTKLKELNLPRYKFMVHVVVGEARGQGVRAGTRSLWDATTDTVVSEGFQNEELFAVATAYAVYLY